MLFLNKHTMPLKDTQAYREYQSEWRANNKEKVASKRSKNRENIRRRQRERREDGFYTVYYLPNEHYVGMTDGFDQRIYHHNYAGKNVEGCIVLRTFDNAFDAHIYETQWHKMGARGCHLKNKNLEYAE